MLEFVLPNKFKKGCEIMEENIKQRIFFDGQI